VVSELKGEKIDIVRYSENMEEYIAAALAPASVLAVDVAEDRKSCRVVVPDDQLSLAIGKEGQNARLAAKLTTWKIDIKSQTQVSELIQLQQQSGAGSPENQGSVIMDDDEGYDNPIVPDEDEIL
jgi:N utilization substance protein A